jgi:UDP-N-acetylglucosamine/UDP-N-acetylgalactosamine diphosphorylase
VTLGSLINFCDCLMAGGTGRKNHSEVGSSYIHFNFTPNQDKATPSLFGDVPRGVMLNQPPIFLGGQGGAVGPLRINFGVTAAAGTILRKDERRSGRLIYGGAGKGGNVAYTPGAGIAALGRIVANNCTYIGNLFALRQWAIAVRSMFTGPRFPEALCAGLRQNIDAAIEERIKRLKEFYDKMDQPAGDRAGFPWPRIEAALRAQAADPGEADLRERFQEKIAAGITRLGKDYVEVIRALPEAAAELGTRWLEGIVARAAGAAADAAGIKPMREDQER